MEKSRDATRKYRNAHLDECRERGCRWNKAHREECLQREYRRKHGNGEWEHLIKQAKKQNDKCAICDKMFIRTPCLDHNHETGQLRGALCSPCNRAIGALGDTVEGLQKAVDYLKSWDSGPLV